MKKYLLILLTLFSVSLCSYAESAPPRLACESLFSNKSLRNKHTQVVINTCAESYYRGLQVDNDAKIVRLIERNLEIDRKRATNTVERYDKGETYHLILNIPNNGYIINIGFTKYNDGTASLFVEAPLDAFK